MGWTLVESGRVIAVECRLKESSLICAATEDHMRIPHPHCQTGCDAPHERTQLQRGQKLGMKKNYNVRVDQKQAIYFQIKGIDTIIL